MATTDCCSGAAQPQPSNKIAPTSVQIYTHNITRRPIAWDPARQRPTQEVVHAIHSALHFALDPCTDHPDEAASFCVVDVLPPLSSSADASPLLSSSIGVGEVPHTGEQQPKGKENKRLVIPCEDDLSASLPAKAELSVKLFAGFDGRALTVEDVDEALEALKRTSGARDIAKFVVALEGVRCDWSGGEEDGKSGGGEEETRRIQELGDVWQVGCGFFNWFLIS